MERTESERERAGGREGGRDARRVGRRRRKKKQEPSHSTSAKARGETAGLGAEREGLATRMA